MQTDFQSYYPALTFLVSSVQHFQLPISYLHIYLKLNTNKSKLFCPQISSFPLFKLLAPAMSPTPFHIEPHFNLHLLELSW